MNRRDLLASLGAAGALGLWLPRRAQARERTVSRISEEPIEPILETTKLTTTRDDGSRSSSSSPPDYRVLEIVLAGGFSCFDTFMVPNPAYPSSAYTQWSIKRMVEEHIIPLADRGNHQLGRDGHTMNVGLESHFHCQSGQLLHNRWRAIAMGHDLLPHEAAVPYAATGTTLGRPYHAGMGAAAKKTYGPGSTTNDPEPSYILYDTDVGSALTWAQTQGLGGQYYPVMAPGNANSLSANRYQRAVGAGDSSVDLLRAQFAAKLSGSRSQAFDTYQAARTSLLGSASNIYPELLAADSASAGAPSAIGKLVRAGISLLRSGNARYVCTIHGGYDSHGWPLTATNTSTAHWVHHQTRIKAAIEGVLTMSASDLDNILVIVTTEFGREHTGADSAHWPYGYLNFVLGGPTCSGSTGTDAEKRLRGRIDATGHAKGHTGNTPYTPADLRAAALYAAGIDVPTLMGGQSDPLGVGDGSTLYTDLIL